MRAMNGWLSALQWTDTGEVSNIELAVDFEVFTGHDILGPPNLAANRRGKTLWTMLATLCRLCRELQLPSPLPAERKDRVGSMRTLGAPMLWGGVVLAATAAVATGVAVVVAAAAAAVAAAAAAEAAETTVTETVAAAAALVAAAHAAAVAAADAAGIAAAAAVAVAA
ncbi:hypothetical protein DIPPA_32557 [Diplonema papillatum]|nr:hypothetical protein DIPPA_32557 [Diplonema papillatum]